MLTFTNISKNLPPQSVLSREVLPDVFQADLKTAREASKKQRVLIYRGGHAPEWAGDEDDDTANNFEKPARRLDIKARFATTCTLAFLHVRVFVSFRRVG